jgi:N-acetylglucosaminyldiphosphoundecaprenol N-acetyl-beta-D-mannosaminyltransferase
MHPDTSGDGQLWEVRALGLRFHPLTKAQLLDTVLNPTTNGEQIVLGSANLHGLYVTHRNREYEDLLRRPETIVMVDGMPVIWLLRALGHPVRRHHRTTWVDWFEDALARAEREKRSVFILGHTEEALSRGLAKARTKFPRLRIDGAQGFFSIDPASKEAMNVIDGINAFRPDLLIVGMGMPRQEIFAARFRSHISAPVIALGGAAFSYFAGIEKTPPRWTGRWGLEWLYRLGGDPRRMGFRYIVEPVLLAFMLGRRMIGELAIKNQQLRQRHATSPDAPLQESAAPPQKPD